MNMAATSPLTNSASIAEMLHGLPVVSSINPELMVRKPLDVTLDSRKVKDGCVFIAVPGELTDGRLFADAAVKSGATAVFLEAQGMPDCCEGLMTNSNVVVVESLHQHASLIAARLFGYPSKLARVIGITGTNGKTTCASLLSPALYVLCELSAMMGTVGVGALDNMLESNLTTADAVETQRILKQFVDQKSTAVCMEVSSHGLVQHRVDAVDFDVAVFTNLSQDHLDFHGTMESYGEAKQRLFRFPTLGGMVVNADDHLGQKILQLPFNGGKISYGLTQGDIKPVNQYISSQGISFEIAWRGYKYQIDSKLCGDINLPNLLAVISTLLLLDYPAKDIADLMPSLVPPPGRMEQFRFNATQPLVVVDYSHTPDSLSRALQSLKQQTTGKVIVVFGCGGDRDQQKRPLMGSAAAIWADQIIVTNDNPRSENPAAIAAQAVAGIEAENSKKSYQVILDRRAAIESAISSAGSNDAVLVAGKGHENTQTIGSEKLSFSDREIVEQLLGGAQ